MGIAHRVRLDVMGSVSAVIRNCALITVDLGGGKIQNNA